MPEKYTQRETEVELGISTRNRNGAGEKVYFWKISKWSREVEVKLEHMNDEKKFQSEAEVKRSEAGKKGCGKNVEVKQWSRGRWEEISRWSKLHFCTPPYTLLNGVKNMQFLWFRIHGRYPLIRQKGSLDLELVRTASRIVPPARKASSNGQMSQ